MEISSYVELFFQQQWLCFVLGGVYLLRAQAGKSQVLAISLISYGLYLQKIPF